MTITVKIRDPETIALLQRYERFLQVEDECEGSMDQIAEGLILGFLDEHRRFAAWQSTEAATTFDLEPPPRQLSTRVYDVTSRLSSAPSLPANNAPATRLKARA